MGIALLTVDDTAEGEENSVPPTASKPVIVRLGTGAERGCEAVGSLNPRFGHAVGGTVTVRQTEQAVGVVLPAGQGKPPADRGVNCRQHGCRWTWAVRPGTQQGWGGMSGRGSCFLTGG